MFEELNILKVIDAQIISAALNSDRDYSHFHPSEWDYCHRKIAYEYYEAKGYIEIAPEAVKIDPVMQRVFGNGHYMHHRYKDYLVKTGALRGNWLCKNVMGHQKPMFYGLHQKLGVLKPTQCECGCSEFDYIEVGFLDPETMWGGHVDAILDLRYWPDEKIAAYFAKFEEPEDYCIVADMKSMNGNQFSNLLQPMPKHITQIQIYMYLSGLKFGKFIYEDKNKQMVKEFLVPRDDNLIAIKREEAMRLKNIVEHTNAKGLRVLPARPYDSPSNTECLSCKFRGHCWKGVKK